MFSHLQKLTALRAENECLRHGRTVNLLNEEQQYAYARVGSRDSAVVVLNNAPSAANLEFGVPFPDGTVLRDALSSTGSITAAEGRIRVAVPARTGVVLLASWP